MAKKVLDETDVLTKLKEKFSALAQTDVDDMKAKINAFTFTNATLTTLVTDAGA